MPAPPLTGSRSESKLAQSNVMPGAGGIAASAYTRDVQFCHDKSFLGAAIGGGPLGVGVVAAAPCGRAPESVAKRGSAPKEGTHPVRTVVVDKVAATNIVADLMCRLMPTTVAIRAVVGLSAQLCSATGRVPPAQPTLGIASALLHLM